MKFLVTATMLASLAAAPVLAGEAPPPPVRILAVGDSITADGRWQAELDRLMTAAGVPHIIETEAVGGSSTDYWPSRMPAILDAHRPDVVLFFTGTNDDANATVWGEPRTSWAWRATAETVGARRVKVLPAWVQYSDPLIAPAWLRTSEPATNDRIYGEIFRYPAPSWAIGSPPAIADFQAIPATATYLDDGGIHPTARGYRYMGRIVYDALARGMGWPAATDPPLCDLYGHRPGYRRPAYQACTPN